MSFPDTFDTIDNPRRDPLLDRLAVIEISTDLIESEPIAITKLLDGLLVLNIAPAPEYQLLRYTVAGTIFPTIQEGSAAPIYRAVIRRNEFGRYNVELGGFTKELRELPQWRDL